MNGVYSIRFSDTGDIIDCLTGKTVKSTPEEKVRQQFIRVLQVDYGYPLDIMREEVPIQKGSKTMTDRDGNPVRADIVVYNSTEAAVNFDQGNISFVIECKKPKEEEGYAQLVSYIFNTSAVGGIWTNGNAVRAYRRRFAPDNGLEEIASFPVFGESWSPGSPGRLRKAELRHPGNVRFLLASCHNKLYGRGMENEDFDLAMDMVRILLAKIQDETSPGEFPVFWITDEQFRTSEGRHAAAEAVQRLFRDYADGYPDVFDTHEKIQVGDGCIAEAVGVLQEWALASNYDNADDWDLMGEAYEQFTHINLKRQQGQFFTNRLVVEMMVRMLDPDPGEKILDPAGGSGGFAAAAFRYVRRKIISSTAAGSPARERQLSTAKGSVFLVEIASRLVKIAKCAMLLTGDGQSGMTRGNSLGPYERMDPWIQSRCMAGKANAPDIILTNPPFSGAKTESMVSDKMILRQFDFGHSVLQAGTGCVFSRSDTNILQRQAPELLFLERCLDWLKPGGRLGIVMPKGFLDGIVYKPYREWLLKGYRLDGVITLHKDTFQPDTGVRTCVLLVSKPDAGETPETDYPVFMARSQRIGQDSRGNVIYAVDANGNRTDIPDHDLSYIADMYAAFRSGSGFRKSEYAFSVKKSDIDGNYNINPQHYSPKLNAAIEKVLAMDGKDGWSVTTVGQLEPDIRIYIGPRWNSSNIKAGSSGDRQFRPYLTANGVLEQRRFTVKWFDTGKANKKQKEYMEMLRVEEGDILITRSGTIGKVTYATKDLAQNYMVSDDLVRVRVKKPELRAYLLAYFSSSTALSLMLRDEYGSVQQHLQPGHIRDMVIPVPDDWSKAAQLIDVGKDLINAMERLSESDRRIRMQGFDAFADSVAGASL